MRMYMPVQPNSEEKTETVQFSQDGSTIWGGFHIRQIAYACWSSLLPCIHHTPDTSRNSMNNSNNVPLSERMLRRKGERTWFVFTEGEEPHSKRTFTRIILPPPSQLLLAAKRKTQRLIHGRAVAKRQHCFMSLSLRLASWLPTPYCIVAAGSHWPWFDRPSTGVVSLTQGCCVIHGSGSCGRISGNDIGTPHYWSRSNAGEAGAFYPFYVLLFPSSFLSPGTRDGDCCCCCCCSRYRCPVLVEALDTAKHGRQSPSVKSVPAFQLPSQTSDLFYDLSFYFSWRWNNASCSVSFCLLQATACPLLFHITFIGHLAAVAGCHMFHSVIWSGCITFGRVASELPKSSRCAGGKEDQL